MASIGGPNIITDGLVLYLDAANAKSYPGSGTVWKDLSGQGNDGTLINGPTFDSENNGSIVFDGVDDYCSLPNMDTYSSNAKFTIEGVVKPIKGNWGRIFTNGSNGVPGAGGFINTDLVILTNSQKPYLYLIVGYSTILNTQISTTIWTQESFTMFFGISVNKQNNTGYYFFRFANNSGLLETEISSTFTPGSSTSFVENRLGAETDNETYMNMNLYQFKIYNRALTSEEILQNYNATKSRFGL